ncbi:hypothetical protein IMZ48_15255 [Candidatus Bathyarchaeota archaeon]|nr:hypothetical protein [Candidatus Bathyarchaeota archaeon]
MVGSMLNKVVTTAAPGQSRPAGGSLKKLLVCAPSNAAVDELVLRLKQGAKSLSGNHQKIKVIRLGRGEAINAAVKDVTLEELVNRRMKDENVHDNAKAGTDSVHTEAAEAKVKSNDAWIKVVMARESGDKAEVDKWQRELDHWKRLQAQAGAKIDEMKSSGKTAAREVDLKRLQFQKEILGSAHVLCATLSGSGHDLFKSLNDVDFETVIIDEAAQCVELSALIPLKYGGVKCILVGDPKQLPPTVLSQSAARYGYDQSLFVRMQQSHPGDVHLLDMQYRMHPHISMFPSREFYEGRLIDGADMAALRRQPWHASTLFSPYRFFDVKGVQSRGSKGQSLVNTQEINVAMQMYDRLRADYRTYDFKRKIGIITPYKAQLFRLRDTFASRYGPDISEVIEFNTTDAFQGRECEIIIFSCVRASPTGGIGFMTDIRRMNVGLTRAKSSLWILGNSQALVQGEYWAKVVNDARARDVYTNGDILKMLQRPTEKTAQINSPPAALPPRPALPPTPTATGTWDDPPQTSTGFVQEMPMHDAPPVSPPMAGQQPHQFGGVVPDYEVRKRISHIDGRGQVVPDQSRSDRPPMIHATTGDEFKPNVKKRQHDGHGDPGNPAKRVCDLPLQHCSRGSCPFHTRGFFLTSFAGLKRCQRRQQ